MGSGTSIPQNLKKTVEEAMAIKVEDVKDYKHEVVRLRKIIKEACDAVEKEKERQAEIASRVYTGKVKIIYQQYQELFQIDNGRINVEKIDEDYCLSDVMPGCKLALLNNISLEEMHKLEMNNLPIPFQKKVIMDDGKEVFEELYTYKDGVEPRKYTVVVYEDPAQYKLDMEKVKARIAADSNVTVGSVNVERAEGCSCIEGNPCTDANKYNCKDWENRFAIAKKNGWSG